MDILTEDGEYKWDSQTRNLLLWVIWHFLRDNIVYGRWYIQVIGCIVISQEWDWTSVNLWHLLRVYIICRVLVWCIDDHVHRYTLQCNECDYKTSQSSLSSVPSKRCCYEHVEDMRLYASRNDEDPSQLY